MADRQGKKDIHCTVKYFAVHNTLFDIEESRSGRQFRGSMTAVIDDSGAVRYKKTPPIVPQPAAAPKRRGKEFTIGTAKWRAYCSMASSWKSAKDSSALFLNTNGYHLEINLFADGWAYNIMSFNSKELLDHDEGYDSMESVIEAALDALVEIWNAKR